MKYVNVDEVLKILNKYGKYIFVTDMKRYSDMTDEISNLKGLKQDITELEDIKAEIDNIEEPDHDFEGFYYCFNEVMKILDKHIKENKQ